MQGVHALEGITKGYIGMSYRGRHVDIANSNQKEGRAQQPDLELISTDICSIKTFLQAV